MLLVFVMIIIVLIDQSSKAAVEMFMVEGQTLAIVPKILNLTLIRNPGAAFGIMSGHNGFFVLFSLIVITAALAGYKRYARAGFKYKLSIGLIAGGASGNLIDRLKTGMVVDFIDFRIWPIFNLADTAIVVGAGLLISLIWKGAGKKTEVKP